MPDINRDVVSQGYLKSITVYDEDTGGLYWRKDTKGRIKNNARIGWTEKTGYRKVEIDGQRYSEHRLVFIYHYGYNPENFIDHIDGNPSNNRIENLREATQQCNLRNSKLRSDNSSGVKGVGWYKKYQKWKVGIAIDGKSKFLGYYNDFDNAVCARLAAEQCLDWHICDKQGSAYKYYLENIR